jgi:hypothetical protein
MHDGGLVVGAMGCAQMCDFMFSISCDARPIDGAQGEGAMSSELTLIPELFPRRSSLPSSLIVRHLLPHQAQYRLALARWLLVIAASLPA